MASERPPLSSFRQSSSPYISSSSTSSPLPPPTWARPTPQPFINGRGNIQMASTPRPFVPPAPAPRPLQGQQAYVRAPSPPSAPLPPSRPRAGSEGFSFPSAFGVRQRVELKRGSGITSSGAGPVENRGTARESVVGRRPEVVREREEARSPPMVPLPETPPVGAVDGREDMGPRWSSALGDAGGGEPSPMSTLASVLGGGYYDDSPRSAPSPILSLGLPSSSAPPFHRAPSPTLLSTLQTTSEPPLRAPSPSIMDRPRPRTPDPSLQSSFAPRPRPSYSHQQSSSLPPHEPSSRRAALGPVLKAGYSLGPPTSFHTPTSSIPSTLQINSEPPLRAPSPSILDRPRPRTPDPAYQSSFSSRPRPSYSRAPSSQQSLSTLPPSRTSSRAVSPVGSHRPSSSLPSHLPSSSLPQQRSSPASSHQPSPSLPSHDPSFHRAHAPSPSITSQRSRAPSPALSHRPSPSTHSSRAPSPAPSRPSTFSTRPPASTSIIDRPRPKTPDPFASEDGLPRASYDRARTPESFSVRPSMESGHGSSGTMLDRPRPRTPDSQGWVDGRASGESGRTSGESGLRSLGSVPQLGLGWDLGGTFDLGSFWSSDSAAPKQVVEEPKQVVEESRQVVEEPKKEKKVPPRLVLRKEPPKIDLKLELELEIDAAILPSRGIDDADGDRTPLARRSVDAPTALRRADSPGPSMRYARMDDVPAEVHGRYASAGEVVLAPAIEVKKAENAPKRRLSLASLLSLSSVIDSPTPQGLPSTEGLPRPPSPSASLSLSKFSSSTISSTSTSTSRRTPSPKRPPLFSIDKSLPPTPTSASFASQLDYTPTKAPSALRRGLSKLRRNNTSSFSVVSGTSTKKPYDTSSLSSAASISEKNTLGRRLANRFGGSKSSGPSDSVYSLRTTESDASFTQGDEPAGESCFPKPPKRGMASGVLGGTPPSNRMLGMSLHKARKSEDLLTRKTEERPPIAGRRSLDLLSGRKEMSRRPSTDNLLILAAAKLSNLSLGKKQTANSKKSPSSVSTATLDTASVHDATSSSPPDSPTTSFDHVPEDASVVVATRVVRSDPSPTLSLEAPVFATTTTARLVRSDSIVRAETKGKGELEQQDVAAPESPAPKAPPPWRRRVKVPDSGVGSDSSMSSGWLDLEDALVAYSAGVREDASDRGNIIANTLLPFLRREEDGPLPRPGDVLAKRQRQVLFGWLSLLTMELCKMSPAHRGACLESVAAIAESRFLSAPVLQEDLLGQARYRTLMVDILSFAVEKLNEKAVYANTLVFSGRVFALAFFRVEGVAIKLLRALPPVKKQGLKRILEEEGINENQLPPVDLDLFPAHLWSLCLRDFPSYVSLLLPTGPKPQSERDQFLVREGSTVVEMSGNWLIRWTASDSDLSFAFYRAYHRQLATHLAPIDAPDNFSPASPFTAPGFLFLSASLLEKLDALIHRNLRSVTSLGANNVNFNTNDSANPSFGCKPKILVLANQRLVSTLLDIVGGPPLLPDDLADAAPDAELRRHAFSGMLPIFTRACVKRTSMWDTRSVFILLDLLEGLVYTLSYPAPSARGSQDVVVIPRPQESSIQMFDIPFIFSFAKIILSTADNTIALMRTIAFLYAHFEIFTLRPEDRDELCENILLDEKLFSRLYLHWNAGVRGYFIRLLVWRLARLGIVAAEQHPGSILDPRIVNLFGLLNIRLEAIRKRHDELEPLDSLTDDDLFNPKRSTICSTRGVKEAPWTVAELVGNVDEESEEDEPQELVRTIAPAEPRKSGGLKDVATVARVVSWLKVGLGKAKTNKLRPIVPKARIDSFLLPSSPDFQRSSEDSFAGLDDRPPVDLSTPDSTWPAPSIPEAELPPIPSPSSPSRLTSPKRKSARLSSPAFFSFEFEGGVLPKSDVDTPTSSSASTTSSILSGDTVFPSHIRRQVDPQNASAVSPRVSLRFSRRISILPPAALDMFKESGEAVPAIPTQYLTKVADAYDKKLHPYAVRGLRDYEDALDEWTDWVVRLQEEEDEGKQHNKGFVDAVPRLAIQWSWSEDGA